MITSIRSFTELMILSRSREEIKKRASEHEHEIISEDSAQRKRYIRSTNENTINLPNLPKSNRFKWKMRKEAISKFLDTLDYNNQIQQSFDLTLLRRYINDDKTDAA